TSGGPVSFNPGQEDLDRCRDTTGERRRGRRPATEAVRTWHTYRHVTTSAQCPLWSGYAPAEASKDLPRAWLSAKWRPAELRWPSRARSRRRPASLPLTATRAA